MPANNSRQSPRYSVAFPITSTRVIAPAPPTSPPARDSAHGSSATAPAASSSQAAPRSAASSPTRPRCSTSPRAQRCPALSSTRARSGSSLVPRGTRGASSRNGCSSCRCSHRLSPPLRDQLLLVRQQRVAVAECLDELPLVVPPARAARLAAGSAVPRDRESVAPAAPNVVPLAQPHRVPLAAALPARHVVRVQVMLFAGRLARAEQDAA